jgi:RNA-directed DNA polymerase
MQDTIPANGASEQADWNAVNSRQANRIVRNLRQRIFRASKKGELRKVASLQKLMLRSRSNILLSVRRVTQINSGRRTAGVDKVVVKTAAARGKLVAELSVFTPWKAKPARRVYIPKSNSKLRPLGIPVIKDRCFQTMVKNALEPFWEARFEGMSYGFRPGRGCHDAIQRIYLLACPHRSKKWVLDADIRGAFDNISHDFLLKAIGKFPARELIKQWLKAGYMEGDVFHETEAGTPQGGVISPLLANIALHGMEDALTVRKTLSNGKTIVTKEGVKYLIKKNGQVGAIGKRSVVRYADDFVVFCETKEDAKKSAKILKAWLNERGLELSSDKTRIVHLADGFDFLGFHIRQYEKPLTGKRGYQLFTKPSKKSVLKIREKLRERWLRLKGQSVKVVIKELNPIIRGWANYFRMGVAKKVLCELDDWMFRRIKRYVRHMHPTKPAHWQRKRYFGKLNPDRNDHWVFGDKQTGMFLQRFAWFPIERHILVLGDASPDDPNLREYWAKRNMAKARDLIPSKQRLSKKQRGLLYPG